MWSSPFSGPGRSPWGPARDVRSPYAGAGRRRRGISGRTARHPNASRAAGAGDLASRSSTARPPSRGRRGGGSPATRGRRRRRPNREVGPGPHRPRPPRAPADREAGAACRTARAAEEARQAAAGTEVACSSYSQPSRTRPWPSSSPARRRVTTTRTWTDAYSEPSALRVRSPGRSHTWPSSVAKRSGPAADDGTGRQQALARLCRTSA